MDNVLGYPALAIPFIRHREAGVKDVDVVVTHQLSLIFYRTVNGENKILTFVFVTKSFQISKDYTGLDIK